MPRRAAKVEDGVARARRPRARRDERVVEGAAERLLSVGAERRVVARADGASRDLRLPRRLPAEVARLVRVERLAVVRGHGHVGVFCVQLPLMRTADPRDTRRPRARRSPSPC